MLFNAADSKLVFICSTKTQQPSSLGSPGYPICQPGAAGHHLVRRITPMKMCAEAVVGVGEPPLLRGKLLLGFHYLLPLIMMAAAGGLGRGAEANRKAGEG